MNFLFAWRYFKAKKSTNAINVIAWVSVVAIAAITFAFIVVLSVFNGFEGLVKSLYSSFYPDIKISPKTGSVVTVTPAQLRQLGSLQDISAWSMIAEEKTLIVNGDIHTLVTLKGVDDAWEKVTGVPQKMIHGNFATGSPDEPAMVLGNGVENAVGVQSDKNLYQLTVYLFKRGMTFNSADPSQYTSAAHINTSGTFLIQQDIDNKYAITNIGFMRQMMGLGPDEYSSVEIKIKDPAKAGAVKTQLQGLFGSNYLIETRYEQNRSLYSVMTLEKWAIYGILTLMLTVAAFTMVGSLTMLVMEKQKDIQVLKALGANNRLVQKIFLSEGLLLAVIFCWAQVKFHLIALQGGTFLIDYYPVKLLLTDFLLVTMTVLLVALSASWLPSRRASMQPIELRS